jgi:hypothetical protein
MELAALLGGVDHRPADAVLHAREWIEELALHEHPGMMMRDDALERDQRRAANRAKNAGVGDAVGHERESFTQRKADGRPVAASSGQP